MPPVELVSEPKTSSLLLPSCSLARLPNPYAPPTPLFRPLARHLCPAIKSALATADRLKLEALTIRRWFLIKPAERDVSQGQPPQKRHLSTHSEGKEEREKRSHGDDSERQTDPAKDAQGRPPRLPERRSVFPPPDPPVPPTLVQKLTGRAFGRQIVLDGPVCRPALCRQLLPDDRKHLYKDRKVQGLRVPARHHRHGRTGELRERASSHYTPSRAPSQTDPHSARAPENRTSSRSCRRGTPSASTAGSSSTRSRRGRRSRCARSSAKRSSTTRAAKKSRWSSSATRATWQFSGERRRCPSLVGLASAKTTLTVLARPSVRRQASDQGGRRRARRQLGAHVIRRDIRPDGRERQSRV